MKSIREIVDSVNFHPQNQYHLGIKKYISRTTFAKANEQRDWRIYKDLFFLTNRKTTSLETNANRKFNKNTAVIEESEIQKHNELISSQLIRLKPSHHGKNKSCTKLLRRVFVQRE